MLEIRTSRKKTWLTGPEMNYPNSQTTVVVPPKSKGCGCFAYGCLTIIVLIILSLIGAYFGIKAIVHRTVISYSTSAPQDLAIPEVNREQYPAIKKRVEDFVEDFKQGTAKESLALSAADINTLIQYEPELSALKDHISIEIEKENIEGRFSAPLEGLGFADRYINGTIRFTCSLAGDLMNATIESLTINGTSLVENGSYELRKEVLIGKIIERGGSADAVKAIDQIYVKDGYLIIVPKHSEGEPQKTSQVAA